MFLFSSCLSGWGGASSEVETRWGRPSSEVECYSRDARPSSEAKVRPRGDRPSSFREVFVCGRRLELFRNLWTNDGVELDAYSNTCTHTLIYKETCILIGLWFICWMNDLINWCVCPSSSIFVLNVWFCQDDFFQKLCSISLYPLTILPLTIPLSTTISYLHFHRRLTFTLFLFCAFLCICISRICVFSLYPLTIFPCIHC
jgi:cytochrome bd-type quinol oxidase subunit 2